MNDSPLLVVGPGFTRRIQMTTDPRGYDSSRTHRVNTMTRTSSTVTRKWSMMSYTVAGVEQEGESQMDSLRF